MAALCSYMKKENDDDDNDDDDKECVYLEVEGDDTNGF